MNQALIFSHFKELKEKVPWISLGDFPTPVERLQNLEKVLGLNSLWIKRDDLTGKLYGGNKVRTLEFSLADAKQKDSELIFAYSALGSNWPLACVIYAKKHNLPTDVFFLPYPVDSIKKQNLQLTYQLARTVYSSKSKLSFPFLLYSKFYRAKKSSRAYLMPPGGTSPASTLGYVNAVLELQQQCNNGEMPVPDTIYCALGSGGTAAGLSIGLSLVNWPTKLIAVRVVDFLFANKVTLLYLIHRTLNFMRRSRARLPKNVNWGKNIKIEHGYFGSGYGQSSPLGDRSMELFESYENQLLDSTYTAKAFAAIVEKAKENELKDKHILFWQTLNSRDLQSMRPGSFQ